MERIINYLLVIAVTMIISSCGIFREVRKEKHLEEAKTVVRVDSVGFENKKITDRSITRTIETIAGNATSKERFVKVESDFSTLKRGDTVSAQDSSGLLGIKLWVDSAGKLMALATKGKETIPVDNAGTKITDQQNNIVTDQSQNSALTRNENSSSKKKDDYVHKEPKNVSWYAFIVLGIVGIVALLLYLIRKFR